MQWLTHPVSQIDAIRACTLLLVCRRKYRCHAVNFEIPLKYTTYLQCTHLRTGATEGFLLNRSCRNKLQRKVVAVFCTPNWVNILASSPYIRACVEPMHTETSNDETHNSHQFGRDNNEAIHTYVQSSTLS